MPGLSGRVFQAQGRAASCRACLVWWRRAASRWQLDAASARLELTYDAAAGLAFAALLVALHLRRQVLIINQLPTLATVLNLSIPSRA